MTKIRCFFVNSKYLIDFCINNRKIINMLLFSLFQSPHIIQHTNSWLRAEYMITEGDDAFGGKVVFEGIDQEICFEQNAIIEAGYILISMMMSNEPADSFCLRGASPPSQVQFLIRRHPNLLTSLQSFLWTRKRVHRCLLASQPMRTECLSSPMHLRENILSVSAWLVMSHRNVSKQRICIRQNDDR